MKELNNKIIKVKLSEGIEDGRIMLSINKPQLTNGSLRMIVEEELDDLDDEF